MTMFDPVAEEDGRFGPAALSPTRPLQNSNAQGLYRRGAKRLLDLTILMLSAPFVLPVIAIFALLIRRDGGPAFYKQPRVGKDGLIFTCWKLRSMAVDAETLLADHLSADPAAKAEWEEYQKLRQDPRITTVGRFIRRSGIDELPQLWCVLRGDMSLVGPRPFLPEQQSMYGGTSYFALRPGITGFWQVNGHNETGFSERASYDDLYATRLSLWFDLKIMIKTALVLSRRDGI